MEIVKTKSGDLRFKEKVRLPNGKLITKSFRRKTDAVSWKRKVETEKMQGLLGVQTASGVLFNDLAERWFELKIKHTLSYRTGETYRCSLDSHIKTPMSGLRVKDITLGCIDDIKCGLLRKGLMAKTINRVLTIIRQVLLLAQDEGLISVLPFKRTMALKHEKRNFSYFEDSEAKALLRANQGNSIAPILYLALHTGMRKGEIFGLCWDRINFSAGRIEVTRTLHARRILQEKTKGGKARYFPMNEALRAFFLDLRKTQSSPRFVFADKNGETYDPNNLSGRSFKVACERANVRALRFHDLRHTFASHFMMNGGNIFDLKELLGHSKIDTTMIYAHLSPDHLKEASQIVNFGFNMSQEKAAGPFLAPVVSGK